MVQERRPQLLLYQRGVVRGFNLPQYPASSFNHLQERIRRQPVGLRCRHRHFLPVPVRPTTTTILRLPMKHLRNVGKIPPHAPVLLIVRRGHLLRRRDLPVPVSRPWLHVVHVRLVDTVPVLQIFAQPRLFLQRELVVLGVVRDHVQVRLAVLLHELQVLHDPLLGHVQRLQLEHLLRHPGVLLVEQVQRGPRKLELRVEQVDVRRDLVRVVVDDKVLVQVVQILEAVARVQVLGLLAPQVRRHHFVLVHRAAAGRRGGS
uniref:(northern house mosquito) hypothetical protein n=1 Tax=Culex pipiens TaxID=7175 RepID=A0A8D8E5W2_CULPI